MSDVDNNQVEWSQWVRFSDALTTAPRLPGVYRARTGRDGPVVYVGMAGERAGGRRPQGLRGRLAVYASGKALASGLGEAVFDRALADVDWVQSRLDELCAGRTARAKHWGVAAFERADLYLSWTVTPDRAAAKLLEHTTIAENRTSLWNR